MKKEKKKKEQSYRSAKFEAIKTFTHSFLLTAEQRRCPIRLNRGMVYFDVMNVAWLHVVIQGSEVYRSVNYIGSRAK